MKAFFSKIWSWIKLNKVISIVIASVFTVGVSCAIVLPIALHEHSYATEWSSDADNHWHDATCKHDEEKSDLAAHTYTNACDTTCDVCGYTRTVGAHVYDNACDTDCNTCGETRTITHAHATTLTAGDTTHYYLCSVCGDKKDEAAHVFDKEIASSEYLKAAATATTKAQYYKSCVCGKASATEYFETDKTTGTLANIQDLSKTYDKVELANPTYETNSDGAVAIEWYKGNTKLDAKPVNAGTYKVKVIIAESATYTGISAEKEFTIAKKVLSNLSVDLTYAGTNSFEVPLGAANGILAGDVADGIKVCITFASKNAGASVTGAGLDADDGDNYTNYELDLTTCTAHIVPKVIDNLTYEFEYNGAEYQSVTFEDYDIPGIIENDSLFLEVCFATPDAGAVLDTSDETGFEPGFNETNYVLGENYNFSIVPKKLTLKAGETLSFTGDYRKNKAFTMNVDTTKFDGYVGTASQMTITVTTPSDHAGTYSTGVILSPYNGPHNVVESKNYDFSEIDTATFTIGKIDLYISMTVEYNGSTEFAFDNYLLTPANTDDGNGNRVYNGDVVYLDSFEVDSADITSEIFVYDYVLSGEDAENYHIDEFAVEITKKKLTNLHLYITSDTYESGEITLIAKDGVVAGEVVKISITNVNDQDFWEGFSIFMQLADGTAPDAYRYETIALIASGDYANYELATYDDGEGYQVVGIVEGVASCDVQYDGSCNCGTSHLIGTAKSSDTRTTLPCDTTWTGGVYKISTLAGYWSILPSDNFADIKAIYDSNGNEVEIDANDAGFYAEAGTYYVHIGKASDLGSAKHIQFTYTNTLANLDGAAKSDLITARSGDAIFFRIEKNAPWGASMNIYSDNETTILDSSKYTVKVYDEYFNELTGVIYDGTDVYHSTDDDYSVTDKTIYIEVLLSADTNVQIYIY